MEKNQTIVNVNINNPKTLIYRTEPKIITIVNYREVNVKLTAYTNNIHDTGSTRGITASGVRASRGRTIAVPSDIPFGTVIEIEGYGTRIVEDRGDKKYIKWLDENTLVIDLYIPNATEKEIREFGVKYIKGKIYNNEVIK